MLTVDRSQNPCDLLSGEHHGHLNLRAWPADPSHPGQLDTQNPPIQIQQRGKRLAVRGGCGMLDRGHVGEKPLHLRATELSRMLHSVIADETPHPRDICLLSAQAVVAAI